ncbi:MAG: hypothetical protein R3E89_09170 [Thiolinea sp.]
MVQLANTLNADAWFNIPHLADRDYIQRYATYVRDNLRPISRLCRIQQRSVEPGLFPGPVRPA